MLQLLATDPVMQNLMTQFQQTTPLVPVGQVKLFNKSVLLM